MAHSTISIHAVRMGVAPAAIAAALLAPSGVLASCQTSAVGFRCDGYDFNGITDTREGIVGEIRPGADVRRYRYGGRAAIVVGDEATIDSAGSVPVGPPSRAARTSSSATRVDWAPARAPRFAARMGSPS